MNAHHSFIVERAAAQHCAELLRRGPQPVELLPALTRAGERIARALAPALAGLTGGEEPAVTVAAAEPGDLAALSGEIGPLAANSLIGDTTANLSLLVSVEGAAVLRLVDRAFGGRGDAPPAMPERFPLSAELLIGRLEAALAACLAEAFGAPGLAGLRRDSRLADLAPFAPGVELAVLRLTVAEPGRAPWPLLVAAPLAHLPQLVEYGAGEPRATRAAGAADPAAAPFADLPLPLTATLVDMRVPLSALATLAPGAVLPVAVTRAVPLAVAGTVLARGTIGTHDDRVAVKLTQIA